MPPANALPDCPDACRQHAGTEGFRADLPVELLDAPRIRAVCGKTSAKAPVPRALRDAGCPVPPGFPGNKRRRGR
jgi:hypothetical protein